MIDTSNPMCGTIVIREEVTGWYGLASIICHPFDFCLLFDRLVFYRCDNSLEEYQTESLKSMLSHGCGFRLAATI